MVPVPLAIAEPQKQSFELRRGALATLDVHKLAHGCESREARGGKEVA